jgi:hypothetical protein
LYQLQFYILALLLKNNSCAVTDSMKGHSINLLGS